MNSCMNSYHFHKMRKVKKEIHANNMREKQFMLLGNVGNIAKQLQRKKCAKMYVLQPSQQPLAHHRAIKDHGKQMVEEEHEEEEEEQTPNAMQTADVGHQVLGSSAMQSDDGELRTDGHEREKKKNREPTLAEMYKKTRARVLGRVYKETGEDTQDKITQMEELQSQQSGKSGEDAESSCSEDPFLAIMGKERNGHVRLHGRGFTPSSLGKASTGNGSSSINVPNEFLESIKADVTAQVAAELTTNMKQTITTQVAQHLCSSVSFHLKQMNPIFDFDPPVLMRLVTTTPSPGDASSAPNQKFFLGLNGDSLIGANRTHSERGITRNDEEEDDDVIDRLQRRRG